MGSLSQDTCMAVFPALLRDWHMTDSKGPLVELATVVNKLIGNVPGW